MLLSRMFPAQTDTMATMVRTILFACPLIPDPVVGVGVSVVGVGVSVVGVGVSVVGVDVSVVGVGVSVVGVGVSSGSGPLKGSTKRQYIM